MRRPAHEQKQNRKETAAKAPKAKEPHAAVQKAKGCDSRGLAHNDVMSGAMLACTGVCVSAL